MMNMETKYEIIDKGRVRLGKGPYEVRDVETNVVLVIRPHSGSARPASETGVAVVNLPPTDPIAADDAIEQTLEKYLDRTGEDPDSIEAILIGGVFQENRAMEDGMLVSYMHDVAAKYAIEALAARKIRVAPMKTDVRATKTVRIDTAGNIEYTQERRGFNKHEAQMKYEDYMMRMERQRCCD